VNYPLQYFVQRIGGELVDVSFPAPRGVDPAEWMPDIDTVAEYQQADVILLNGAGYARWLRRMSLPAAPQPVQSPLLLIT
jgi:zinc transport system substrate-binding protein